MAVCGAVGADRPGFQCRRAIARRLNGSTAASNGAGRRQSRRHTHEPSRGAEGRWRGCVAPEKNSRIEDTRTDAPGLCSATLAPGCTPVCLSACLSACVCKCTRSNIQPAFCRFQVHCARTLRLRSALCTAPLEATRRHGHTAAIVSPSQAQSSAPCEPASGPRPSAGSSRPPDSS